MDDRLIAEERDRCVQEQLDHQMNCDWAETQQQAPASIHVLAKLYVVRQGCGSQGKHWVLGWCKTAV